MHLWEPTCRDVDPKSTFVRLQYNLDDLATSPSPLPPQPSVSSSRQSPTSNSHHPYAHLRGLTSTANKLQLSGSHELTAQRPRLYSRHAIELLRSRSRSRLKWKPTDQQHPLPLIRRNIGLVQASSYALCELLCRLPASIPSPPPGQSMVVQSYALHAGNWGWLCTTIVWARKPTTVTPGD